MRNDLYDRMEIINNICTVYFIGIFWFCVLLSTSSDGMKLDFRDKVVLITDACSLIGASLAYRLAKLGATLSLTGSNATYLENIAKKCSRVSKLTPFTTVGDFSDSDSLKQALNETVDAYSKVDVLIYNPDFVASKLHMNRDFIAGPLNYTLCSYYSYVHYAIPYLEKTQGTIIDVGLNDIYRFTPGSGLFDNTITQFTRCASDIAGVKNIRVNGVNPGFILEQNYTENLQKCQALDKQAHSVHIIRDDIKNLRFRDTTIEHITKVVTYLASEYANVTNGEHFTINGNNLFLTTLLNKLK